MTEAQPTKNNSSFSVNQSLSILSATNMPALIISLSEWSYIKTKLTIGKNWWYILETIGGVVLGIGANMVYVKPEIFGHGSLICIIGLITIMSFHSKGNEQLSTRCAQALDQMKLIEERYSMGDGQSDSISTMAPNDTTISNQKTQ